MFPDNEFNFENSQTYLLEFLHVNGQTSFNNLEVSALPQQWVVLKIQLDQKTFSRVTTTWALPRQISTKVW